ncbi:MAG: hypothetical protein OJF47_002124 [Nitrospira sp.]|nr:MAG: hypothetical protein OJF47_002124 [Nitrospira sp.]
MPVAVEWKARWEAVPLERLPVRPRRPVQEVTKALPAAAQAGKPAAQ